MTRPAYDASDAQGPMMGEPTITDADLAAAILRVYEKLGIEVGPAGIITPRPAA